MGSRERMKEQPRREEKLRWTKEPYIADVGPRKIETIQFGTFSGDEIRKLAEVQVWSNRLYGPDRKPVANGLLDSRMGAANKQAGKCATCHGNFDDCPGHFGYLKLALPVFNVGFFNSILNLLKCICKSCGRILLEEHIRKSNLEKMRKTADAVKKTGLLRVIRDTCNKYKNRPCPWCGITNGVVKKGRSPLAFEHNQTVDKSADEFRAAFSDTKGKNMQIEHVLSPLSVLSLFKKMLAEDCELLNLSDRPEKLIVTDIAVPPVSIRPSVFVDDGRSSNEDSITSILKSIINTNSILREDLEGTAPALKCLDCWAHLQIQVVEYINSEAPSVPESKHRGFVQRLKGKTGRFRGNLCGKRTNFTGRTVISPDPNLKITEVAIPVLMAKKLTYPEMVSSYNIEKLRQRVSNGPDKYPGACLIILPDGTERNLRFGDKKTAASELKIGYKVERHLEDGDIVLFNRQPSLHRMSIMSHRARVMPWRTLRFNESVCNPYNADFDGDEMNLHVPQTEEARTEALMLMGVQNNLCTPKNGEILVASTQDFLTSSFLITRKDTFYDRGAFSLMCSYMGDAMDSIDLPTPAILKPIELWTGKQLFSVLVRPNASTRVFLNFVVKERLYNKDRNCETMCPSDAYVYFRNSELICGQLGKTTLGNGNKDGLFSVLLRDYNSHAAASCMNRLAKLSARWIGNHGFSIGIDDVQPGGRLNTIKDNLIRKAYNDCYKHMSSFSKGELTVQSGCDAAQTLELTISGLLNKIRDDAGKVCMNELHWRNSPLIMSQCGSKGSSMNICQMIVCVGQQSVGGRRAPNGFLDRTLPHFPKNLKTAAAKGFVANSFYTGLTPTEFFFHTMGGREGLVDTAVKTAETGYMSRRLMKALEDLSTTYDQTVRDASGIIVQFLYGDDGMDPAKMEAKDGIPLNLDQLFMKVLATCPPRSEDTLSPADAKEFMVNRFKEHDMSPEGGCSGAFKESLSVFVRNRIDALKRLSSKQLQVFLETCISRYHSKKVEAGAPVGALGAQSISEPGTQMTLKTFHFAGVASMNVTLGVPRIKEIINASKNISTPIITAALISDADFISARIVKSRIEKTVLGEGKRFRLPEHVLHAQTRRHDYGCSIIYFAMICVELDAGAHVSVPVNEVAKAVKIVLKSSQPYIVVKLDMKRIEDLLMKVSAESVRVSIVNHPKLKLKFEHIRIVHYDRLRIYPPEDNRSSLHYQLNTLKKMLPQVIVKGIPTIERAVVNKIEDRKTKELLRCELLAEGTNLLAVMGTPGIDASKTKSSHVLEVQRTLGIEAARQCIINEIKTTIDNYNMSIDTRHMMLLADLMTYQGEVLGMTRFGVSKMKSSVLMLASFEKTTDHLFNASYDGRVDQISGVSECIIMGIPMQLGTGILQVKQRLEKLPQFKYEPDPILG